MNNLNNKNGFSILNSFNQIGQLISNQISSLKSFDANDKYGSSASKNFQVQVERLYNDVVPKLNIPSHEDVKDWKFNLPINDKGILDTNTVFSKLRQLPDDDIRKVRLFNRFVSQQLFSLTVEEIFEYEERHIDQVKNPFWKTFNGQAKEYAKLTGEDALFIEWPREPMDFDEKKALREQLKVWTREFAILPGISDAIQFFKNNDEEIFNNFFHVQRQFDSDNWKDFDKDNKPNPQPLPRIAAYRKAIADAHSEFQEAEANISMCFDYCRLSSAKVVMYVRTAEESFLKIANRLEDEYPLGADFSHTELHKHVQEIKHMMFPLRCAFYEELESMRSANEATDNTLDSYMDMTLGSNTIGIPNDYIHPFKLSGLEDDLSNLFKKILPNAQSDSSLESPMLTEEIQKFSTEKNEEYSKILGDLSLEYEQKYKADENNLNRRLARLTYLYTTAMSKKDVISKASQERLDDIEKMASKYAKQASSFQDINIEDENSIRSMRDDQIPMMASPQQLEDLYHTQKVVARLADSESNFSEVADQIEKGLLAAMKMMKKAEELMVRIIKKMFPNPEDSIDLLAAIHRIIELSYDTQKTLADIDKKEALARKKKSARLDKEVEDLKSGFEEIKEETKKLQNDLIHILKSKRELVEKMKVTKSEKEHNLKQLQMITKMTVSSMQAQAG